MLTLRERDRHTSSALLRFDFVLLVRAALRSLPGVQHLRLGDAALEHRSRIKTVSRGVQVERVYVYMYVYMYVYVHEYVYEYEYEYEYEYVYVYV